jgi:hypothetical protein
MKRTSKESKSHSSEQSHSCSCTSNPEPQIIFLSRISLLQASLPPSRHSVDLAHFQVVIPLHGVSQLRKKLKAVNVKLEHNTEPNNFSHNININYRTGGNVDGNTNAK